MSARSASLSASRQGRRSARTRGTGSHGRNRRNRRRFFVGLNPSNENDDGCRRRSFQMRVELADDTVVVVVRRRRRLRGLLTAVPLGLRNRRAMGMPMRMRAAMLMRGRVSRCRLVTVRWAVRAFGMQMETASRRRQSKMDGSQRPANKMSGECTHRRSRVMQKRPTSRLVLYIRHVRDQCQDAARCFCKSFAERSEAS